MNKVTPIAIHSDTDDARIHLDRFVVIDKDFDMERMYPVRREFDSLQEMLRYLYDYLKPFNYCTKYSECGDFQKYDILCINASDDNYPCIHEFGC